MIYPRELKLKLKPYLERKEIIAIKGPRQSGKTTLMQDLYNDFASKKRCLFLTFEKRSDLEIFETDIENFKKIYADEYDMLFIDEFQYAKEGGQKLKYLFDTTSCKFIISGSSSLELTGQTGQYLVGRLFSFHLSPFSFQEFLRIKDKNLAKIIKPVNIAVKNLIKSQTKHLSQSPPIRSESLRQKINNLLKEYIIYGGYPEAVLTPNKQEKRQVLKGILDTYLLRDIKTLLNLATDEQLIRLAKFLSLQIGNLVNYQELSASSALSFNQVRKHLKILAETYILELILPFFRNKRTELSKNPKVFFLDTGFRNMLLDNFSPFEARSDQGVLFENYVFSAFLRNKDDFGRIKFWRTQTQAEVDFILEKGSYPVPVEVKSSQTENIKPGKSFFSFVKKYKPKIGLVITRNYFGQKEANSCRIYFLPGFYV